MRKFGKVNDDGQVIILVEEAAETSRLMHEYGPDLQYKGTGDTYMTEWAAQGKYESDGAPVMVYWHFEIAREGVVGKGQYSAETLPENYDWENFHQLKGIVL